MSADEGLLSVTRRSPELLGVIRTYGDPAMDFIWNNKSALTVGTLLAGFLAEPEIYFSGIKSLVNPAVKNIVEPIVKSVNWTLILAAIMIVVFMPFLVRSVQRGKSEWSSRQDDRQ
jgi:hypothetical protein